MKITKNDIIDLNILVWILAGSVMLVGIKLIWDLLHDTVI